MPQFSCRRPSPPRKRLGKHENQRERETDSDGEMPQVPPHMHQQSDQLGTSSRRLAGPLHRCPAVTLA